MPENEIKKDPLIIESWMFRKKEEIPSLVYSIFLLGLLSVLLDQFGTLLFWTFFGIFIIIFTTYIKNSREKAASLLITRDQLPEIYELFEKLSNKLGIKNVRLYIKYSPDYNAFAFGVFQKAIVLHSALVDDFSKEELEFVLAHELGHIKAGHTVANAFIPKLPNLPFPFSIINDILSGFYDRNCEYTCDRCAVAVTKNPIAGVKTILKLMAGKSVVEKADFSSLADQIRGSRDFGVWLAELVTTHPFPVKRINHILKFSKEVLLKR